MNFLDQTKSNRFEWFSKAIKKECYYIDTSKVFIQLTNISYTWNLLYGLQLRQTVCSNVTDYICNCSTKLRNERRVSIIDYRCQDGGEKKVGEEATLVSLDGHWFPLWCSKVKECTMRGHQGTIDQMCWHKTSGDLLATCGSDKTVRVWDARSQKCQAVVQTKGTFSLWLDKCMSKMVGPLAEANKTNEWLQSLHRYVPTVYFTLKKFIDYRCDDVEIFLQNWVNILVSMRSGWFQGFKNADHGLIKTACSLKNCKKTFQIGLSILISEAPNSLKSLLHGNLGEVEICRLQLFKQLTS